MCVRARSQKTGAVALGHTFEESSQLRGLPVSATGLNPGAALRYELIAIGPYLISLATIFPSSYPAASSVAKLEPYVFISE